MIPAPGCHWFWYGDRPFQAWFSRTEDTRERAARRVESLTFRTVGRKRAVLEQFIADVVACHTRKIGVQSCLFTYDDGCWDEVDGYAPRLLDSVVLKQGEKENLVRDIERFRDSKTRYARLGVPYHRGYLLYGPPGTGKTSLVSALAAHFALPIYCVNLSELNDRTLVSAINRVPSKAVVLFEDIDCMKSSNTREEVDVKSAGRGEAAKVNGVSLSGLLNVLDGFYAPSGVLFVMTTNHIELLDPALLRPGRIDYRLFMGKAERAQKVGLYLRFFPEASEAEAEAFVATHGSEATMAEFQGLLLAMEIERIKVELVSAR
jgi:mitochondrial chaperone BCS1